MPASKFICSQLKQLRKKTANLVVSSMFIQERDDRFYMVLLNDVQNLRAFNQDTVQHLENA